MAANLWDTSRVIRESFGHVRQSRPTCVLTQLLRNFHYYFWNNNLHELDCNLHVNYRVFASYDQYRFRSSKTTTRNSVVISSTRSADQYRNVQKTRVTFIFQIQRFQTRNKYCYTMLWACLEKNICLQIFPLSINYHSTPQKPTRNRDRCSSDLRGFNKNFEFN